METNVFNELVVVKRSGQRVPFNGPKIAIAIKKAYDSVYLDSDEEAINKTYNKVLNFIEKNYVDRKTINVEDIQDIIENILQQEKRIEVYESFNNYRIKRKAFRDVIEKKPQHKFIKASERIAALIQTENKNPMDLILNFAQTISEEFSKSYLIDSKYIRSHEEGNIYIHDLNYYIYGTTSSTHLDLSGIIDYDNFFERMTDILINIKKEQHGEHSVPSIDHIINPWLIYEFKKIFKKNLCLYIEAEGFGKYINLNPINLIIDKTNTMFISINIFNNYIHNNKVRLIFENAYNLSLLEIKKELEYKLLKLLKCLNTCEFGINKKYGYSVSLGSNSSKEGVLITETYLKLIEKTERLNNVATIYKVIPGNNLEIIPRLILANKNISISNIYASFNKKYLIKNLYKTEVEYFSDGNRILENVLDKNQSSVGRMIISKSSINLVRVALKSKDLKEFYQELDNLLEFVKNELLQTFEYISSKSKKDFKYLFNNGLLLESEKLDDNQKIRKLIKNGVLNIGYSGLKECVLLLNNKSKNITSEDNLKLATDIIKYISEKCNDYSQELRLNFSAYETCEADALKSFGSIDLSIYGDVIKSLDEGYFEFYKNFNNIIIEDRFKITSKLQKYSSGGYQEIITIPKTLSSKKILEIINSMVENDVGFIKIKIGKSD